MIAASHAVFAQAVYYPICILYEHVPTFSEVILCVLASSIPDFDTKQSLPGQLLPFVSEFIGDNYGHRTVTHSFVFLLLVSVPLSFLVPINYYLPIITGLVSHPVADMFTKAGVQFWWPFSRVRCVCWKNVNLRIEVYGFGEFVFTACMLVMVVISHRFASQELWVSGLIQHSLGEVKMAIEEYQSWKGENVWMAGVRGRSNLDQQKIDGDYKIVDVASDSAFFIEDSSGKVVTAGQSQDTDWYVDYLSLTRGPEEKTSVANIILEGVAQDNFVKVLQGFVGSNKYYLVGRLNYREASKGDIVGVDLKYEGIERVAALGNVAYLQNIEVRLIVRGNVDSLKLSVLPQNFEPLGMAVALPLDDKWQSFLGSPSTTSGW